MTASTRAPDFGFVRTWFARYWLAVWFAVDQPRSGVSALVDRRGRVRWPPLPPRRPGRGSTASTRGSSIDSQRFAAPPPTLIPLAPIALLPEDIGVAILLIAADRRCGRHGPAPASPLVVAPVPAPDRWRVERQPADPARAADPGRRGPDRGLPEGLRAGPDRADPSMARAPGDGRPAGRSRRRSCRGRRTSSQFGDLSEVLADQSDGGMSATAVPWLIPIAVVALLFCRP